MSATGDIATLPDLRRDTVDATVVTDAIAKSGAILVRELVPAADVLTLDDAFQQALAACKAGALGDWFTPYDDGTQSLPLTRAWIRSLDCALVADSPAMIACVLEVYRRNGIIDLVSEHLGEVPVLSSQKSTLRRTLGNRVYTDNWHQDGAFLGAGTKVVNVWLALTACGERAASVEIGLRRQTGIVSVGGEGALFTWSVSPQQASKVSPASVTPVCAPGDALLFDHLCLHRTSINPAYTGERRAIEAWFFAPSTYPHNFDPRPIRL
jgi:hypothetical protein